MFCPRLCDYLAVVGCTSPRIHTNLVPEPILLRCFPPTDHADFALPKDVVYFCQPEGCVIVPESLSDVGSTSFVFTLTDKDSGKVRFGICLNYYRPFMPFETSCSNYSSGGISTDGPEGKEEQRLLTSLCIISHHPFFSKFRKCLHVLKQLLDASERFLSSVHPESEASNAIWCHLIGGVVSFGNPMDSLIHGLTRNIEIWIMRFLSTPAPLPGKSCVQLSLLPIPIAQPMVFALPDKTRLSLVDFPLHLPLELLGVDNCLKVLTAIMLEQKVLLQSRDYNSLTMSVMAFIAMLYPLQYMFPAIPLLPTSLEGAENLLLSPTPYLIGIPANFLSLKKHFVIPPDVWLVDLDTNRMMGSCRLEPIPSLPFQEGHELFRHLEHTLTTMCAARPVGTTGNSRPNETLDDQTDTAKQITSVVDDADVATRVAMVRFFDSPNILANLSEHTRTVRLYPRPVVALQHYSFLKSRQHLTPFIQRLSQTQAVEFLSEWTIYPENEVFQRIHAGIIDPALIGDKAKWFASTLPRIHFDVWSEDWCQLLSLAIKPADIALPYVSSLFMDSDSLKSLALADPSSFYHPPLTLDDQLSGAVLPKRPVHYRKKTRPNDLVEGGQVDQTERFVDSKALAPQATIDLGPASLDSSDTASSELDDEDIRDLETDEPAQPNRTNEAHMPVPPASGNDLLIVPEDVLSMNSGTFVSTDSGDLNQKSLGNAELSPRANHGRSACGLIMESPLLKDAENSAHFVDELEEVSVGSILMSNFTDNWADVASHASNTVAELWSSQKDIVQRSGQFALRVVGDLRPDSLRTSEKSPLGAQSTNADESLFWPGFLTKFSKRDRFFSRGTIFNRRSSDLTEAFTVSSDITDPALSSKAQSFLREVVMMVVGGKRLNPTYTTKLQELLKNENYRSYLVDKLRAQLSISLIEPVVTLPDIALPNQAVFDCLATVLHCMLRGLEFSCTNHGIGGLASAATMLEVCHIHYVEPNPSSAAASPLPIGSAQPPRIYVQISSQLTQRRMDQKLKLASFCNPDLVWHVRTALSTVA